MKAICANCDEPIESDPAMGWLHVDRVEGADRVPCMGIDVPVAEPASVECDSERYSWDLFSPEAVDSYWMRCDLTYPHDEHENQGTGAKWTDALSSRAREEALEQHTRDGQALGTFYPETGRES